jgi:hypothetical protein
MQHPLLLAFACAPPQTAMKLIFPPQMAEMKSAPLSSDGNATVAGRLKVPVLIANHRGLPPLTLVKVNDNISSLLLMLFPPLVHISPVAH